MNFIAAKRGLVGMKGYLKTYNQRWSRGHKARGQGQGQGHKKNPRPRPRTAFPRTDTLEAKDRNARGQGQGPRTQSASALQKKKKKRSSQKFFRRSQNFNIPKNRAVFEPRTGQFSRTWGLEAKAKDFKMCPRGRPRGQGRPRGLHLCIQPYEIFFAVLKRAFNPNFEKLRKNLRKYVYQHDPIAILATHPVKKV